MAFQKNQIYTKDEVFKILNNIVDHTFREVDKNHVLDRTINNPKITGIAGDVIEQSVFGYKADPKQEADLLIDNVKVELKTTGIRISKKSKNKKKNIEDTISENFYPKITSTKIKDKVNTLDLENNNNSDFEAKEPMSITAVSPSSIVDEKFDSSHFWEKLQHLLIVYYHYNSYQTVKASEYADFIIKGYEFHEFTEEEKEKLKHDWEIVRDFIQKLQQEYGKDCENEYPRISYELRDKLLYLDTAPKWPHNPRFRLKRTVVTSMVKAHFNNASEEKSLSVVKSFSDIDRKCIEITEKYKNYSIEHIGKDLPFIKKIDKSLGEKIVLNMFEAKVSKMNSIPLFVKAGIIGKTIILTYDEKKGTEDMKLFPIDFEEIRNPNIPFEESSFYTYFSQHIFLCIVFKQPEMETSTHKVPLKDSLFLGFKKITFPENFILNEVQKTWDEIRDLVNNNKLKLITTDKVNATGVISDAPNFPKSKTNEIFVRGSSSDSTNKPLVINGLRMYDQYIWISKKTFLRFLTNKEYIK